MALLAPLTAAEGFFLSGEALFVIVVGDSLTYGQGIDHEEDLCPAQLHLSRRSGDLSTPVHRPVHGNQGKANSGE